jgi:hypothetical protein
MLPFVLSVAFRYLLFVPQVPDGCEPLYLSRTATIKRLNGVQSDFIWLKYTGA